MLQVCLVNDPRNPYNRLLTVEYLSNMVNGRLVLYNNQSVDVLKKLAAASLRDNEVHIPKSVKAALGFPNCALGSYCLAVTQAKRCIVFVCPNTQCPCKCQ